jgi:hypothetical protein
MKNLSFIWAVSLTALLLWMSYCGPGQSPGQVRDSLHSPTGWIHLLFSEDA